MKKYTSLARKGFTLVELMIVIAIIGILAAVLYPAMTGYFERSRDTNRQAGMQQVNLALSTYFTDNEKYPQKEEGSADSTLCLADVETELKGGSGKTAYVKQLPKDPQAKSTVADCTTPGSYAYELIANDSGGTKGSSFKAAARVESKNNGNIMLEDFKSATKTSAVQLLSKTEMAKKTSEESNYALLATTAQ